MHSIQRKLVVGGLGVLLIAALGACSRSPETKRDRFVSRAKGFVEKKDYPRAILEFKNAVGVMPRDAEVFYQLGLVYRTMQDYRPAVAAFRRAAELNPRHAGAQLQMAQILAMTNDPELWKDAQNRLKALMNSAAETSDMINVLALTELKMGNVDNAVQYYERVLARSPGESNAALMLARARLSQKDPKGAEEVLRKACESAPNSTELRVILSELYITLGKMPAAQAELEQALKIDPNYAWALLDLARLNLTLGRKDVAEQQFKRLSAMDGYGEIYATFLHQENRRGEAIQEFERLAKQSPDDRQARTHLVAVYRLAGRATEAEKILNAALKKNPKDEDALLQRAEMMIEKRNFGEAEVDANKVMRLRPAAAEVHYVLAKLHQGRGAVLLYRQALAKALELNPGLRVVRLELAQQFIQSNEGRAALDTLNNAPESQKKSPDLLAQRNWALWTMGDSAGMRKGIDQGLATQRSTEFLIQDGLWKLRAQDPAGARASLEEALKIDSSDLRALQGLNQAYLSQKKQNEAIQKVKQYAAANPKSVPVQDFLGLMLMASGDRAQARTVLNAAKGADPKSVKADLSLVQLDVAEGRIEAARKRLTGVVSSDTGNLTARKWLGIVEAVSSDHSSAIEHFREVATADPGDAQAANNLAYLLSGHRDHAEEALKYAQKAVELAPAQAEYCDTLGWILYQKGLYSPAIQYLERAVASSGDAVARYHLAMAYTKAGDAKRGRVVFEAAAKLSTRVPEAKAARELLEQVK